jgi:integrase
LAAFRRVPLPGALVGELQEHRRRQAEERKLAGPDWQVLDLVLARFDGRPLHYRNLTAVLEAALKSAGLERIRLYDLRHTCASILMAEGLHPKVVAERLGHSNISFTVGVYSHVLPGMQEEAAAKLEKAVFGVFEAVRTGRAQTKLTCRAILG